MKLPSKFGGKRVNHPRALCRHGLNVELLEDRIVLNSYLVSTTTDNGDDLAPIPGSFRQAILLANAHSNFLVPDDIAFSIGNGPQTITVVNNPLPRITESVIIDGTSQPGYTNFPLIMIRPAAGVLGDGLRVDAGIGTVQALNIGGFQGNGIFVAATGNGNILDSYIGTNLDGTAAVPNQGNGIAIQGSSDNAILDNLISGNARTESRSATMQLATTSSATQSARTRTALTQFRMASLES